MDRASRLRQWARQCRRDAAEAAHQPTVDALLALARQNEEMAKAFDRQPAKPADGDAAS